MIRNLLAHIALLVVVAVGGGAAQSAWGRTPVPDPDDSPAGADNFITDRFVNNQKIPIDSTVVDSPDLHELVIVGPDTVSMVLPQKNYGRYDRGLYNYLFIPKRQWSFGLTASYGEFNTEDFRLLDVLNDLDVKVKAYSIKPTVSYFFANNQSIGLMFNYTRMFVDLGSMVFDFDDDMNFSLSDVSYHSNTFSAAIFYRNYIGLGRDSRFAVFNDVDLSIGAGNNRFLRSYDGQPRDTRTSVFTASLNFSPGVCVFIMDNVGFNVSFGVFGLNFRSEQQSTNSVDHGKRFSSGANFKFNIFNINFGMAVFI